MAASFVDGPGLLERQAVQRPGRFSGEEADWPAWAFKFESFAALCGWSELMDTAKMEPQPVDMNSFGDEALKVAAALYHTLVQLLDGRALGIIHLVPRPNGLEAWRALVREYQPRAGGRFAGMLRAILRPEWWQKETDFRRALATWDAQVMQYETQSAEKLSDTIKAAVILEFAPRALGDLLALAPPETRDSYALLRDALRNLSDGARTYANAGFGAVPGQQPVPMDTSAALAAAAAAKGFGNKGGQRGEVQRQLQLEGRPGQRPRRRSQGQGPGAWQR